MDPPGVLAEPAGRPFTTFGPPTPAPPVVAPAAPPLDTAAVGADPDGPAADGPFPAWGVVPIPADGSPPVAAWFRVTGAARSVRVPHAVALSEAARTIARATRRPRRGRRSAGSMFGVSANGMSPGQD